MKQFFSLRVEDFNDSMCLYIFCVDWYTVFFLHWRVFGVCGIPASHKYQLFREMGNRNSQRPNWEAHYRMPTELTIFYLSVFPTYADDRCEWWGTYRAIALYWLRLTFGPLWQLQWRMEIVLSISVCDQMGPTGGSVLSGSKIKQTTVMTMFYLLFLNPLYNDLHYGS